MCTGVSFEVGDHDFTKFSLVPSVASVNKIPSALEDSWYRGQVIRKSRAWKVHQICQSSWITVVDDVIIFLK